MKKVETNQAPAAIGPYVQGNIVNGLLFSSGQLPMDPKTGELVEPTIEAQTKQAMENIRGILASMDLDFNAVVKTTCFLSDIHHFAKFNEVYGTYFTENLPARSCFEVACLPKDALVEIEFIAEVKA